MLDLTELQALLDAVTETADILDLLLGSDPMMGGALAVYEPKSGDYVGVPAAISKKMLSAGISQGKLILTCQEQSVIKCVENSLAVPALEKKKLPKRRLLP